jgi:glycyl-tRNA synthetase beta chain
LPAGRAVRADQLEKRDNYVYAVKRVAGRPTAEVLPKLCLDLLDSLRWGKAMRWNSSGIAYPRPLRWITALYGDQTGALHVGGRRQRQCQPWPALRRRGRALAGRRFHHL